MNQKERIVALHQKWLRDDSEGVRADFSGADLNGADFHGINLREAYFRSASFCDANFRGADLHETNFYCADLRGANFSSTNLTDADLRCADFSNANLCGASLYGAILCNTCLHGADLCGANLRGTYLYNADLTGTNLLNAHLPPVGLPEGDLIVYGKKDSVIVKLLIKANTKRTACLINRKCRAESAFVLEVENDEHEVTVENHWGVTVYREGEIVNPNSYDDDIRVACSHGIHFFMTREEAERWY